MSQSDNENIIDKKKRPNIPKKVRNDTWDVYIGREKGIGKCYACLTIIDSKHFECGHIIPNSKGGKCNINNFF